MERLDGMSKLKPGTVAKYTHNVGMGRRRIIIKCHGTSYVVISQLLRRKEAGVNYYVEVNPKTNRPQADIHDR